MINETKTLKEGNGVGFKRMYPTKWHMLPGLKEKINPNPKTEEEALNNKMIHEQIKQWSQENE
jgi:hypothetical protein